MSDKIPQWNTWSSGFSSTIVFQLSLRFQMFGTVGRMNGSMFKLKKFVSAVEVLAWSAMCLEGFSVWHLGSMTEA